MEGHMTVYLRLAAGVAALCLSAATLGQEYPARSVRLIVAYPPGGPNDILARVVSPRLGESLGQQVVVENRAGADGNIGLEHVAKAAPDGYTLLLGDMPIAARPALYKSSQVDVRRDLAPIGFIASAPMLLVVAPGLPMRSVAELIASARSHPGQLSFVSPSRGTPPDLAAELFRGQYGLDVVSVPYKGVGAAFPDLLSGRVSFLFVGVSASKSFIDSGKLRALAITGRKRAPALPEVPTLAESGYPLPDLDFGSWWGLLGPRGLPKDIVGKLNGSLAKTLALPEVHERLAALNFEPVTGQPEEFDSFIASEIEKWSRVIGRAGIKPE
jgi:tripartite-type tricarboxylate transporter receptor subunit TctC